MTKNVYTVGQINLYIKDMLAQDFLLRRIYAKGEVSNCKYHTSGHLYFSLKDETGVLQCVMFAGKRGGLTFRMQDGQSVIVLGRVEVYEQAGRYQLYAEQIFHDGAGFWHEQFEQLKERLAETGMFAPEYKRPIPAYAKRIGIVTAPTGAAIRDIQNIARRRNPYAQLILYPALVQGEGAAASIVKGIETLDRFGVDVIIAGRGGGSIEDLWAFNEEAVAYAIFHCHTPVISAVGHETDFTIADYVADLRAPTPSAAAELAVADVMGILAQLDRFQTQLARRMENRLYEVKKQFHYLQGKLALLSPQNQAKEQRKALDEKEQRLKRAMEAALKEEKNRLLLSIERLRRLSPLDKLKQGYAYVADAQGRAVTETAGASVGDILSVYVTDGCIRAAVTEVLPAGEGR